jgi:prolipoprotein diacylglyceryltransferase
MGWLKYSALAVFTILSILFATAYPYYSRQALYLTLKRNAVVEVNGVIVPGEILGGRLYCC